MLLCRIPERGNGRNPTAEGTRKLLSEVEATDLKGPPVIPYLWKSFSTHIEDETPLRESS